MPAEERILELLAQWEEQRQLGHSPAPEELCPDDCELREAIRERIERRLRMQGLWQLTVECAYHPAAPATPAVPNIPGYEFLGVVGQGGMGVVYKARHIALNRLVAVKMLLHGISSSPQDRARFKAEAEAVARVPHPHIVQIYEVGEQAGCPYLVLEYLAGGSLAQHLDGTPLPAARAAQLVLTLAGAVHHAHQHHVIHRDLKPANVLLGADGVPKLTDFGLARRLDVDASLTHSNAVLGTPNYMAPEQAGGRNSEIGPAADVHALGIFLYELLTGRPPFSGSTLVETLDQVRHQEPVPVRRLQPRVPRDLETICAKCLQKQPRQRYASAADIAEDLRRYLAGEPIRARPVRGLERLWRWCRRKPLVAALTSTVLLLTVVIAAGAPLALFHTREERDRARKAADDARTALHQSYLSDAGMYRASRQAGQRFEALDRIAKAVAIRPTAELRDEAIACLALTDVRVLRQWEGNPIADSGVDFDAALEHYAVCADQHTINVHRVADGARIQRLIRPDNAELVRWFLRFSPDGKFLAAVYERAANSWEYLVWEAASGRIAVRMPGVPGRASLAFSPDSRWVAAGDPKEACLFYDLASGKEVKRFPPGPPLYYIAFDPQGQRVALASSERQIVEVRAVDSGQKLAHLQLPAAMYSLAWSPDGRYLAAGCIDSQIHVWDVAASRRRAVLIGHQAAVTVLAYLQGGDILASASWDGTTRLWEPRSGRLLVTVPGYMVGRGNDGRRLGFRNGTQVGLWELAVGHVCRSLLPDIAGERASAQASYSIDFSPEGDVLAAAGKYGVRFWDVSSGREADSPSTIPTGTVLFHRQGRGLLTSGDEGVQLWPLQLPKERGAILWQAGPPRTLWTLPRGLVPGSRAVCSADGHWLAFNDPGSTRAILMDLRQAPRHQKFPTPTQTTSVAISPNGRWLAAASYRGNAVLVWEVATRKETRLTVFSHPHLAFSPDGEHLVTGEQGEYRFWEVGSWREAAKLPRRRLESVEGPLAFSRDGRLLAVVFSPQHVQLIEPTTRRVIATLTAPDLQPIQALCFSPDNALLAVATDHQAVQLWDLGYLQVELARRGLEWRLTSDASE